MATGSGVSKRKRTRDDSCDDSGPSHQRPGIYATRATPALFRPEEQHPLHSHDGSEISTEVDNGATMDEESRGQSVAADEVDSAVGIAHKVCILHL